MQFEMECSVHLIGGRILNISIHIDDVTLDVVNRAIDDADSFVRMFLEAEMERYDFIISPNAPFPTSKLNDGYNRAQKYLLQFNVNMVDYLKLMGEQNKTWEETILIVIEDAMIVSRLIRDALIEHLQMRSNLS